MTLTHNDKYNRPLSDWLPKIIKRVKTDEKLSPQVMKTFLSNCEKLKQSHGDVLSKSITLETVNDFVQEHAGDKSVEVQNRKIIFLNKIFDYMVDMSAMDENVARKKKLRPVAAKKRKRLKLADFQAIHAAAPHYLKTAMELAIQTTHAVLEVSRLKYSHCRFLPTPEVIEGMMVFGYVRIHRQKVQKKESSRVEIPITQALKSIIEQSRADKVLSPYVVHRISSSRVVPKECDHPTQITSEYISKAFSALRDELKLFEKMNKAERPTFHEIRALSIHLFTQAGYDPQARAAHADAKSTKVYQENHVEWVRVPAGELQIG
ncbi:site-specific integrase [Alteromonas pelagimontana]|nr:integrase [Alteromonas pelagimontana]